MSKICLRCKADLPLDEFPINRPSTGGRHSYCRPCLLAYNRERHLAKASEISEYRKAHRAANPEAYRARARAYYEANTERISAKNKAAYYADLESNRKINRERTKLARSTKAGRERAAGYRLKAHYGITLDDYNRMLDEQGGLCANPGCFSEPPENRRFDIDHDHSCCPGEKSCGLCIRGLICGSCNRALGLMHDDPKRLLGLAEYLERQPPRQNR